MDKPLSGLKRVQWGQSGNKIVDVVEPMLRAITEEIQDLRNQIEELRAKVEGD